MGSPSLSSVSKSNWGTEWIWRRGERGKGLQWPSYFSGWCSLWLRWKLEVLFLILVEDKLLYLVLPTIMEKAQNLVDLNFGGSTFFTWVCYSSPYTKRSRKMLILSEALNRRRFFNRYRLLCRLLTTCTIWPSRFMILEVSVADRDAIWSHWQDPIGKSQNSLRILKQGSFLSADNYSLFQRQLLTSYWVLVETECLTRNQLVIMWPEVLIMGLVLFDPQNYRCGLSNGRGIYVTAPKKVFKMQVKWSYQNFYGSYSSLKLSVPSMYACMNSLLSLLDCGGVVT